MTDGTLGIVDDVAALGLPMPEEGTSTVSLGEEAINRIVRVVGTDGVKLSVNFHGVGVENGMVLVSDVGSADSASDGALYVFADDGELNGEQSIEAVAGPATMLSNPVDVLLVDGAAIVAEKSNDAILVFNDVASLSGDVTPDYSQAFTKPESLVKFPDAEMLMDASDIATGSTVSQLLVSQNTTVMQQGYDDFFAMGTSAVPSRTIRAAAMGAVSNIHGIVHDLESDTLIVSDVADAASASDGALYVIDNASTASGEVVARATITGAATALGNPVDLAFDGIHADIAETSNY